MAQSSTSITIGIVLVAALFLVLLCALVLVIVFIRRIKIKNEVIKTSTRLRNLQALNARYYSVFCRHKETQNHTVSLDSKAKFDRFNPVRYFALSVAENSDNYEKLLTGLKSNKLLWQSYKAELCGLQKTQYEKAAYIKLEDCLFNKHVLNKPVVDVSIVISWEYTSPQGRNRYHNSCQFCMADVSRALESARKKNTRQARISKERALMTDKMRYQVMERDGFRCVICGSSASDGVKLHVDHIYPVAKGGKTEMTNLRTLCDRCNLGKGAHIEK